MISGVTKLTAVLGWPVDHSRSPQVMNAAFAAAGIDAVMIPIGVAPDGFAAAVAGLRAMGAVGASVTVPHKIVAVALCDELSPAAKAIGAVNCLQLDGEVLTGHNTDEGGFLDGLVASGFDLRGKRCLLLGAGGAARAVAYALRGARAIEVIARNPTEVGWVKAWPWTAEQLCECFARTDLVVDCTSMGLAGPAEQDYAAQLPLDALAKTAWVSTLVYHRPTILLERAKAAGYSTLDGRAMLVHQAARAFTIWTGIPAPVDVMTRALDESLTHE